MKNLTFIILLFLSINVFGQSKKKAIIVLVDGIPADVLQRVETPHLDSIAKIGGYTNAYVGGQVNGYSQSPTISAVGYNSYLTGTWANKHNVWGNSIKKPNYNYPTIFRVINKYYPDKKMGIFSTWEDNRTKLLGEKLAATGNLTLDYVFDGYEKDTLSFPHDKKREYIKNIDQLVTEKASETIKKHGPDFSWVYLEYTDDMGHAFGDSDTFNQAVEFTDSLVGQIYQAVQYREKTYGEEWAVFITTDHGRHPHDGKHHGGQTERERDTWIVTNLPNLNRYFTNYKNGIVDVFPTLVDYFSIDLDFETAAEIDGTSFLSKPTALDLKINKKKDKCFLTWDAIGDDVKVEIFGTKTDHFAIGEADNYELIASVSNKDGEYELTEEQVRNYKKLILKTPTNILNTFTTDFKN